MPVVFKCPGCGKSLRVADDKRGKRIKCSGCNSVATIPIDDDEDEIEVEREPVRRSKNAGRGKGKRSMQKSGGVSPLDSEYRSFDIILG